MEQEEGRVLVEGGPVHLALLNRVNVVAAFLIPVVIGLAFVAFVAFKTASDLKAQRHATLVHSCAEANERHTHAVAGLEAFVLRTNPKAAKKQQPALEAFVNALLPSFNCKIRVAEQEGHAAPVAVRPTTAPKHGATHTGPHVAGHKRGLER